MVVGVSLGGLRVECEGRWGNTNVSRPSVWSAGAQKEAPPRLPPPSRLREKVHLGPSCLVRTGDPVAAKGERDVQGHSLERARRPEGGGGLVGSEQTELTSLLRGGPGREPKCKDPAGQEPTAQAGNALGCNVPSGHKMAMERCKRLSPFRKYF